MNNRTLKILFAVIFAIAHIFALANASDPTQPVPRGTTKEPLIKLWPGSKAPAGKIEMKGVPNFGKLNGAIWRSGQPTREGYELLAAQGLKTVINLRAEYPQDKALLPKGVRYVYLPIVDQTAPTDAQAEELLKHVANPDNWPILIHCHAGEGRAGVMAAIIRHSFDGWDHEAVMNEVLAFRSRNFLGFTFARPLVMVQRRFLDNWDKSHPVITASGLGRY